MAKTETKRRKDEKRKRREAKMEREKSKYADVRFKTLYVINTRSPSSNDDWDRGDTCTEWIIPSSFTATKEWGYHSEPLLFEPKPGEYYFMVYAIWSTGDTFGHDEKAYCEAFGIYQTKEEAEKRKGKLKAIKDYSTPWNGYFNHLNTIDIQAIFYTP